MIFRNSVKQVVRTPARTVLFVLLLAAITAFLTIGIGLHLSATRSIALADSAFTTIGVISHRDRQTPDFNQYDIINYDYSPITDSQHVKSLDYRVMLAGVAEEMHTVWEGSPFVSRSGTYSSVIEFTPRKSVAAGEPVQIRVLKVLHSYGGSSGGYTRRALQVGDIVELVQWDDDSTDEEFHDLQAGKSYVAAGWLLHGPFTVHLGAAESLLKHCAFLEEDASFPSIMEIETEGYLEGGDGLGWARLVKFYQDSIRTLSVYTTNDLASMLIFHQGNARIIEGRSFSQADYDQGARVCIVNAATARLNNFRLGDRISLAFTEEILAFPGGGVQVTEPFGDVPGGESYEIIGLYTVVRKMGGSHNLHPDTVFVPQRSVPIQPEDITGRESWLVYYSTGVEEGTTEIHFPEWDSFVSFRLTNGSVEAFSREMEQHDLPGLTLTFYDQGYGKVSNALTGMQETAAILTTICAAAGVGIVLLFALLFVGRQQRTIAVMYSLGAGRQKALTFLLLTVLMVALLAVAIGGVSGLVLSDTVFDIIYARNVQSVEGHDYSGIRGELGEVDFQAIAPPRYQASLMAAASVLVVTLIFSGVFAAGVLRAEPMQVLTAKEE